MCPKWAETIHAPVAAERNINIAAERTIEMIQLEQIKNDIPASRGRLKEAGESL